MSRNDYISPPLYEYLLNTTSREPEILARLREETARLFPEKASMQIGPDQGQFMGLLAQAIRAKKTIEIGVFTGYSSLAVALALPGDARIFACDVSDEWTSVARRYWEEAGVLYKIALRIAPAIETLTHLCDSGQRGTFDLAFIDADKSSYDRYYEVCLELLRPGGLLLIDNTLWSGRVADASVQDDDTRAIRALNDKIGKDKRVEQSLLTIGDGLTIVMKL
jgi:predicted O-methyltransferase YrrM